ncbi:MAG: hypothetical protein ACYDHZ_00725 [Dehalococcoidia bacterium]
MTPVGANGISSQGKGINGVQTKQTLSPANETVNKGVYDATTLSAVDADLAVGNIKAGVNIFGFLGTYSSSLAEDTTGSGVDANILANTLLQATDEFLVLAGSDADQASTTNTYSANSRAVVSGFLCGDWDGTPNMATIRLYANGVAIAESGYISTTSCVVYVLVATVALSGSKICKISVHNYDISNGGIAYYNHFVGGPAVAAVAIGSIKIV